ncbi:MAG: class C sortase [Lachnospiraceae bacterium]|nr:class C sortase [Lachnospiraceae bacterium]
MKRREKRKQNGRNDRVTTIILVCVLLAGIVILAYPSVSNWWNHRLTAGVVSTYDSAVDDMSEEDYSVWFEAAEAYNEALNAVGSAAAITSPELVDEDYWDILDITGTGVMGYITIEKIDVQLPIYHGTDVNVLQVGAGHLEGTSLPVGGESTHSVISAHRGLPSALLFTNLNQLEVGDTFTITVLNRVMTYEVDQISIVEPDEVENLYIEEGKDYCTLMTCTPYGINTHRLLVRGVRVENADSTLIHVTAEAERISPLLAAPVLAVPMVLFLLIWVFWDSRRVRKKRIEETEKDEDEKGSGDMDVP